MTRKILIAIISGSMFAACTPSARKQAFEKSLKGSENRNTQLEIQDEKVKTMLEGKECLPLLDLVNYWKAKSVYYTAYVRNIDLREDFKKSWPGTSELAKSELVTRSRLLLTDSKPILGDGFFTGNQLTERPIFNGMLSVESQDKCSKIVINGISFDIKESTDMLPGDFRPTPTPRPRPAAPQPRPGMRPGMGPAAPAGDGMNGMKNRGRMTLVLQNNRETRIYFVRWPQLNLVVYQNPIPVQPCAGPSIPLMRMTHYVLDLSGKDSTPTLDGPFWQLISETVVPPPGGLGGEAVAPSPNLSRRGPPRGGMEGTHPSIANLEKISEQLRDGRVNPTTCPAK